MSPRAPHQRTDYDLVVVGAGMGGIYAAHRFSRQGLSVLGIEGAEGVGGVWNHNRYPGARVDLDSIDYCYYFDAELWRKWQWAERNAAQPELLAYLDFVADTYDIKRHFRFGTWVTGVRWNASAACYRVRLSTGDQVSCRFLVMTSGQLSAARRPEFPGLEQFGGEWVMTSQWPHGDVALDGRRIAVIGTGSSGVQVIPELAKHAEQLYVFQRTPNFVVPAQNHPSDPSKQLQIAERLEQERELLLAAPAGTRVPIGSEPAHAFTSAEQRALMQQQWDYGGQGMNAVFSDEGTDAQTNDLVVRFVHEKVRERVGDPAVADKLVPDRYPIGTRRLCLDTGYYETFNQANVRLIDVEKDPIIGFTKTGIESRSSHYEVDLVVFALGFHAFTGALERAGIRNADGQPLTAGWTRGPRTLYGLMTTGFPNLFLPTGPGSPSVLTNLFLQNEFLVDWIGDCITYLDDYGHGTIEASAAAQDAWTTHSSECASNLLRLRTDNYMVHVNADDKSRVFIPYSGGFDRYVEALRHEESRGYNSFNLV